jgi:hypothetical protein
MPENAMIVRKTLTPMYTITLTPKEADIIAELCENIGGSRTTCETRTFIDQLHDDLLDAGVPVPKNKTYFGYNPGSQYLEARDPS